VLIQTGIVASGAESLAHPQFGVFDERKGFQSEWIRKMKAAGATFVTL
jgi:hypothetical protein